VRRDPGEYFLSSSIPDPAAGVRRVPESAETIGKDREVKPALRRELTSEHSCESLRESEEPLSPLIISWACAAGLNAQRLTAHQASMHSA
jgi:hypothetical protein